MGITFFAYACEAIVAEVFARKMKKPRIIFPIRLLLYILIFGSMAFFHSTNKIWLNVSIDIAALITVFSAIFTFSLNNSVYYALILEVVNFMSELLFGNIASHFISNFWSDWELARNYFFISLSKALLFAASLIISKLYKENSYSIRSKKNIEFIVTLIMLCVLAYLTTMSYVAFKLPYSPEVELLIYVSLLLLFTVMILTVFLFKNNKKMAFDMMNMQVQLQKNEDNLLYAKSIEEKDENLRILVHDIKNHLQSLSYMCEHEENEKATQYIDELIKKANLKATVDISPNKLLNSIIYRYYMMAKKEKIDFTYEIRNINTDFVEEIDITTIVCNLLDNAFESCGTTEPFISISMYSRSVEKSIVVSVENSCTKNPATDRFGKFISQKGGQFHGYGIESIKRTAEKYNGDVNLYYSPGDQTFHAVVLLNGDHNENSNM